MKILAVAGDPDIADSEAKSRTSIKRVKSHKVTGADGEPGRILKF